MARWHAERKGNQDILTTPTKETDSDTSPMLRTHSVNQMNSDVKQTKMDSIDTRAPTSLSNMGFRPPPAPSSAPSHISRIATTIFIRNDIILSNKHLEE